MSDRRAIVSAGIPTPSQHSGFGWFHAGALLLVLVLTLPASAAGDRAVKSRVSPSYPEMAKRMKISGAVKIEATVDADGKVTAVKTLDGNRMLSTAAEDAVKKWKFEAGTGETTVEVTLNFALAQ
jgi:TonB family protein